jgi:hypothetical protein
MIRKMASSFLGDVQVKQTASSFTRQSAPSTQAFSTTKDNETFGVWQPNQTTQIFQRMEETCPGELKAYAQCVIEKQNSGALVKGACEESFLKVMDCFRSVRR